MANAKVTADPTWYAGSLLTQFASAGGYGQEVIRKSVSFSGAAGNGAVGTVALFTVTGAVAFHITAICTENLVSGGGGTISVGTAASVAGIIGVTNAVDIDIGEIWFAAAPATVLDTMANGMLGFIIGDGADIQANILVGDITDGQITFMVWYVPLTQNAAVVAA